MKATPGGHLPVNEVFGRDEFIERLWGNLERHSIRMEAERRIGKTCILRKMADNPPKNRDAVFLDLEQVHSATEFAEIICTKVVQRLDGWKRQRARITGFLQSLSGAEIGGFKLPDSQAQSTGYWKKLLTCTIQDLVEQQAAEGRQVVFFFDELPWMLSAISGRDGPQTAMEVLDVLRHLRQDPATGHGFRMIQCGSIGLHHVLGELAKHGYQNQPVNDMQLVEVPPLDPDHARRLAGAVLKGERLEVHAGVDEQIAQLTGGFPYYIHWIISELKMQNLPANKANVDQTLRQMLTAEQDPCSLRHFLTRIDKYYPQEKSSVLALLDHAAVATAPLPLSELINVGKTADANDDNRIRELVRMLSVDHYLRRDTNGHYVFRHALLKSWWVLERGIA